MATNDEASKLEGGEQPDTDITKPCEESSVDVKCPTENDGAGETVRVGSEESSGLPSSTETDDREKVDLKIVYNKQKLDLTFPLDELVSSLKTEIEKLTGVPVAMQKVMFKGRMRDDVSLREHKVIKGSKIMVVGSTVNDVMSVTPPDPKQLKAEIQEKEAEKEPLSTLKPHKTVLDKHGKPDDAMPGIKNVKEALPPCPVSGMYNKSGGKVRLTFKLDLDQLWIGTKERTDKIPMGSIKAVSSEALKGHEEYHMMGIQLGTTDASKYWVYWVPAQYVDAIKDAILGKWQFF